MNVKDSPETMPGAEMGTHQQNRQKFGASSRRHQKNNAGGGQ